MVSNLVTIATNYFVSTNWFLFHDFLVVLGIIMNQKFDISEFTIIYYHINKINKKIYKIIDIIETYYEKNLRGMVEWQRKSSLFSISKLVKRFA